MSSNLLITSFAPFPTLSLHVDNDTLIDDIPELLTQRYPSFPRHPSLVLSHGSIVSLPDTVGQLSGAGDEGHILLRLGPRMVGGKGGFGSQLRAAGGRMSSQRTSNNDSCRDLNGRRLSTIRSAKRMAEYLADEEGRKQRAAEEQRKKLETLEKELGIGPSSKAPEPEQLVDEDGLPVAGPSKTAAADKEPTQLAGIKRRRFDDTEYLEQSRELVDGVKSAVAAGLLRKKKKAKLAKEAGSAETSTPVTTAA
jgi:hypothetical protein